MSGKLGKQCWSPRCPNVVTGAGAYCDAHKAVSANKAFATARRERLKFYSTAQWQRIRKLKLGENPLCEKCGKVASHHVHHRERARDNVSGRFVMANLEALCARCHRKETQRETRETARKGKIKECDGDES